MAMDRATAEAHICDITLNALLEILEKYPKKKPVFKAFCSEYGIADIDELTEALGLEVLDIIDNRTYILTTRAKEAFRIEQEKTKLRESIDQYLELNKDKYIILSNVPECWLIAKRLSLIVYNRNDNPVFQPYETNETKEYFMVFVAKTSEEFIPDEMTNRFITRGCKMVKILDIGDINRKLEGIR